MWILWKGKWCDILVQRAIRIIAVIWEDSKHCWFADKPVIQILKAQEQSQEKKKKWNSGEEEAMTEFNGSDRSFLIAFACKY